MTVSAPRLSVEQWLARIFADDRPRHLGTGWLSGVLGIVLALLALLSVLCLHFPQYLTLPELRGRYPLGLVHWQSTLACWQRWRFPGCRCCCGAERRWV